ncbi:apolipoprotein L3-like isoform X7 [Melanotaenia boesemani]|uniref:apolipoprotein L3-like isoform X7 n=1 Tax=Melanotaenia boesemani TaxID=1250792 RepID=UPI001C05C932|nr:apolipoprotein L3-like isoform X7 [Melanotaenia boesemani]
MLQPNPPVPLPRNKLHLQAKSLDEELKSSCHPKPPQRSISCSTPPPVAPRPWAVKKSVAVCETEPEYVEIMKVIEPSVKEECKAHLPPLSAKKPQDYLDDENETLDTESLSDFNKTMTPWKDLCRALKLRGASDPEIIEVKAKHLYKAMQMYTFLMTEHGENLKQLIGELYCIADNLDKVSKGTKIAGITGGATTVAGGVAAAAGVILSPFTMGASLALTAVGVGVATAGGVTGASAAIANKASSTHDKKKIDKTLQDFSSLYEDILTCLRFITEGMEQLKLHGLSVLKKSQMGSKKVAKVVELAMGEASGLTSQTCYKVSGMISGFALGMDIYFTKGKKGHKVKKGLESTLAQKIRTLSEDLDKGLKELVKIKELFSRP